MTYHNAEQAAVPTSYNTDYGAASVMTTVDLTPPREFPASENVSVSAWAVPEGPQGEPAHVSVSTFQTKTGPSTAYREGKIEELSLSADMTPGDALVLAEFIRAAALKVIEGA